MSTSLAALSCQVLGLQHLRALIVACTRVVTLDTLRIITFPRLLKFSTTPVLIPFGVRTLSGLPYSGQAPVGDSTGGGFFALPSGADPGTEQQTKGTDPRTGTLRTEKKSCFLPTAGITFQLPREGCRVGSVWSAFPCFACWSLWLAGPCPLSPVAPGCFPGRPLFLRVCFFVTSEADRGGDPVTEHFYQVPSGTYCSGGYWPVVVHFCCGTRRVDMPVHLDGGTRYL